MRFSFARFAVEAAFIVLVAVGAALADLGPVAIVGVMALAWALAVLAELAAASRERGTSALPGWLESAEAPGLDVASIVEAGRTGAEVRPRPPRRSRLPRRFATQSGKRLVVPRAPLQPPLAEVEPGAGHAVPEPRTWVPPSRRWPGRRAGRSPAERERRATSDRREEPHRPPQDLESDLEPAAGVREPAPASATTAAAVPHAAREWNVWELERLARGVGGRNTARDQEWAFLLVYLREFATPEGLLPSDFDALVRESFPELVAAVEDR